jgi:tetratricopeptide (TPR) repeat protein/CHAT domain-containing protein
MSRLIASSIGLVVLLVHSCPPFSARADQPQSALSDAQRARIKERDQLFEQLQKLSAAGNTTDAISAAEKMLAIDREVYGDVHEDVAGGLMTVAELYETADDLARARRVRDEAVAVCVKLHGTDHVQVEDARRRLAHVDALQKMAPEQRRQLALANQLMNRVRDLDGAGKYKEALAPVDQALDLRREVLGPKHWLVASPLHWRGRLYSGLADFARAEASYREALAIRKETIGEKHPEYAATLESLANTLTERDNFAAAEPMLLRTAELAKEAHGEKSVSYATSLHNLSFVYKGRRDFARAEELLKRSLQIKKEAVGEKDSQYVSTLNALASLYYFSHDYVRAETLYREAFALNHEVYGDLHPDCALTLNNMALVYQAIGDVARAESQYREAMRVIAATLGERHPRYATTVDNLAELYLNAGQIDKAEQFFRQAVELKKRYYGAMHPEYIRSLHQLGFAYQEADQFEKSEAAYREVLAVRTETEGPAGVNRLNTLNNLAILYNSWHKKDKAEEISRQVVDGRRKLLSPDSADLRSSINDLAYLMRSRAEAAETTNDFTSARRVRHEVLDLVRQTWGDDHWRTTDARIQLANTDRLESLAPADRERLRGAERIAAQLSGLEKQGKPAEEVTVARQAAAEFEGVLGKKSRRRADCLSWASTAFNQLRRFDDALQSALEAHAIRKELLGEKHPDTIFCLNEIGYADGEKKDFAPAAAAYRQALALRKVMPGRVESQFAQSVENLAITLNKWAQDALLKDDFKTARRCYDEAARVQAENRGDRHWRAIDARNERSFADDYERLSPEQRRVYLESVPLHDRVGELCRQNRHREALPLAERLVATRKEFFGENHGRYTAALCLLALAREHTGDFARAEKNFIYVLELGRQNLGEKHPDHATNLFNLAHFYDSKGQYTRAEPLHRQAAAIRREVAGEWSEQYAAALNNLGWNCSKRGDLGQELFLYSQAVAIKKRACGPKSPDYAVSLGNLAMCYESLGDGARAESLLKEGSAIFHDAGRPQLQSYAWTLRGLASIYRAQGHYAKAEPLFRQCLEIYADIYGKTHSEYAELLESYGRLLTLRGDFDHAQSILEEALRTMKQAVGDQHPEYASPVAALAVQEECRGNYSRAEALFREALEIRRRALGENHERYAASLRELAKHYEKTKDYARAESLFRQALEIKNKAFGKDHPDCAEIMAEIAGLYHAMGDYARSELLFREVLDIQRRVLGESHINYATTLNNLGLVYLDQYDFTRAEPLFLRSLAVSKERLGEKDSGFIRSAGNLASLYRSKGDYAAAEKLYQQMRDVYREVYGEQHPSYALSLYQLAWLHYLKGDSVEAERLLEQALVIYERSVGPDSVDAGKCVQELAEVCAARGQYDKAEALARRGLEIDRRHLEQTAEGQSERQQLATMIENRRRLDFYLSVAGRSKAGVGAAYEYVLAWKGAVSGRQRDIRRVRRQLEAEGKPEAAKLYADLTIATGRLAALSRATPDPDDPGKLPRDLAEASRQVERLETELAAASASFRAKRQRPTDRDIRAALPPDTVLVDLLDCYVTKPELQHADKERVRRHFLAFVIRPGVNEVKAIDLGPIGPIVAAVNDWRKTFGRPTDGHEPGAALRGQVWEPLQGAVAGAKTVLVSPDGVLSKVPWAALPGKEPGTYLIEDVAVAVVPVPAQLSGFVADRSRTDERPSLLVVGDVRFDGPAGFSGTGTVAAAQRNRGGDGIRWPALPGTRDEAEAIENTFKARFPDGRTDDLRQDNATEAAVRREASRHRFLHFATHGYFAPPQLRSALAAVSRSADGANAFGRDNVAGFHPGLLSGLVLAGANHPPALDQDDGILTALEVEGLDLDGVDLATLSACETGLGETAAGEGLLGLQRAFQTAGARSVVAGLWKVDDMATQVLMKEFYARLWDGKHGKLDALREAQLAVLRSYDPKAGRLRGVGGVGGVADAAPARSDGGRLSPYYWAAFTLSGDWR